MGICKIKKSFRGADFVDRMRSLVDSGQHSLWWENVLYSFTDNTDIHTIDVDGRFWSDDID